MKVTRPRQSLLGVTLLILLLSSDTGKAAGPENDLQLFTPVSLELPVYKKLHATMDYQSAIGDNVSGLSRMVLSPGLLYELSPSQSMQAGYSHIRQYTDEGREISNALFQTLQDNRQIKGFYVGNTGTVEEEFLEGGDTSVKAAYRISLGRQIKHTRWRALINNEIVFNLNNVPGGPQQGVDQNRTFIGVGRCFTLRACTRTGYQLQYIHNDNGPDRFNHRIYLGIIINTTGPAHIDRFREQAY